MGMNYYVIEDACPACGRDERRHIGKSSAGWTFVLHIYPDEGIRDLRDWQTRLAAPDARIVDDRDAPVTVEALLSKITERRFDASARPEAWYAANHAVPGPNGLARHVIDDFCVGYGEGPWDYVARDFS